MRGQTAVEKVRGVLKAIDAWTRIGVPGPCDAGETKAASEAFEKLAWQLVDAKEQWEAWMKKYKESKRLIVVLHARIAELEKRKH